MNSSLSNKAFYCPLCTTETCHDIVLQHSKPVTTTALPTSQQYMQITGTNHPPEDKQEPHRKVTYNKILKLTVLHICIKVGSHRQNTNDLSITNKIYGFAYLNFNLVRQAEIYDRSHTGQRHLFVSSD